MNEHDPEVTTWEELTVAQDKAYGVLVKHQRVRAEHAERELERIKAFMNERDDLIAALQNLIGHTRWVSSEFGIHYAHLGEAEEVLKAITA